MKGSLCYRCEYRACFLENGRRPRFECGDTEHSKYSCYMYRPVKPVELKKNDDADIRPQFCDMSYIQSRSHSIGIADVELCLKEIDDGVGILYWKPVGSNIKKQIVEAEKFCLSGNTAETIKKKN